MKIDKRRPGHWLLLIGFAAQALLGLVLRPFSKKQPGAVILYGHKLNGNLLALHQYMKAHSDCGFSPVFLSMDGEYLRTLKAQGVSTCHAAGLSAARLLARAGAVVSSHGLHSLGPLLRAYQQAGLKFFDVWHGIPFKGFDAEDFRLQHRFDETWVASELNRDLYINRFGFDAGKVFATGYARTDRLVKPQESRAGTRAKLGLPENGRLVLFAPTWRQDSAGRSLYPFGCSEDEFLEGLSTLAAAHDAGVVLRSHMNSAQITGGSHENLYALPGTDYPDAESILLACDILICDWSSIAFDWLLLNRPTLFLDVPPPFAKGFSLGPEYRFGPVVKNLPQLLAKLESLLQSPSQWQDMAGSKPGEIRRTVYGECADGRAAGRCMERMKVMVRRVLN